VEQQRLERTCWEWRQAKRLRDSWEDGLASSALVHSEREQKQERQQEQGRVRGRQEQVLQRLLAQRSWADDQAFSSPWEVVPWLELLHCLEQLQRAHAESLKLRLPQRRPRGKLLTGGLASSWAFRQ